MEDWLEAAEIDDGPLFRPIDRSGVIGDNRLTSNTVTYLVRNAAEAKAAEGLLGGEIGVNKYSAKSLVTDRKVGS